MPKFTVWQTITFALDVEAANRDAAIDLASATTDLTQWEEIESAFDALEEGSR